MDKELFRSPGLEELIAMASHNSSSSGPSVEDRIDSLKLQWGDSELAWTAKTKDCKRPPKQERKLGTF